MIRVTDILSKPVISLLDSKTEGIVKNAVFDKNFKKLKYLILFDNNEHQEEKTLSISNIYSYGENAIVVKEENDLNLEISSKQILDKPFPINNSVYTYLGKFVGIVSDIVLDEKFNILSLIVNDKEIELKNIISSGIDAVIIQDDENKVNIKTIKRKKNNFKKLTDLKVENNQKVSIFNKNTQKTSNFVEKTDKMKNLDTKLDDNTIKNNTFNVNESLTNYSDNKNENEEKFLDVPAIGENVLNREKTIKYQLSDNPSMPKVVTTNYEFLIGRKLDKNIYAQNRELIARKNCKITNDIINKAKIYYKIRELIKYSHN